MTPPMIGKPAPYFTAKAVVKGQIHSDFSLRDFLGQYVVFFFYPLDFTFVCPTELHAFQEQASKFAERNAVVIACSIDSEYSHLAWIKTPKNKGGIQGIEYPIVSDINKSISKSYQVLNEEIGIAYRGQFIIDRQGIIRHHLINDFPIGRSVDESIRLLDALISFERNGEVCPANWNQGAKTLQPTEEGLAKYFN